MECSNTKIYIVQKMYNAQGGNYKKLEFYKLKKK